MGRGISPPRFCLEAAVGELIGTPTKRRLSPRRVYSMMTLIFGPLQADNGWQETTYLCRQMH